MLVSFIRPSTDENYEKIWFNIEKILTLIKPFTHPNNSGRWTPRVLSFFSKFVVNYVKRNAQEKKIRLTI